MRHHVRPLRPLRAALLAAVAAAAIVLALPGTATYAAWRAQAPLDGTLASGTLTIDAVGPGSWQHESGAAFDPATGRLEPGRVVLYRTTVDLTATGENLRATLRTDVAASLPADLAGRVTVTSEDVPVVGSATPQRVPVTVRVAAASSLPSGDRSFSLRLDLQLGNGHGWQDTASRDLGTLTTRGPAAGGLLRMGYDLTKGVDRTVVLYVDDVDATVQWVEGAATTRLVPGRNAHTYPAGTVQATVLVNGRVGSLGSPAQSVADMQELVQVQNWQEGVGTVDASYAFHNAINLLRVDGLPSTLRTTDHMFSNARSLKQDFPGPAFANVESMSHMFAGATSFNGYVGGWDTAKVRDMSGMFHGATSFNSWIGGWNTSNVEDMTDMFRGARAMAQSVAGWDVGRVTAWDGFNADAPNLTTYLIPAKFRPALDADAVLDAPAVGDDPALQDDAGDEPPTDQPPTGDEPTTDSGSDATDEPATDDATDDLATDDATDDPAAADVTTLPEPHEGPDADTADVTPPVALREEEKDR